jgi:hypothetical protein
MHGRICMIAAVGFIVPGFVTFWKRLDRCRCLQTHPTLEAAGGAPAWLLVQIFAFMGYLEFKRITSPRRVPIAIGDSQASAG